METAERVSIDDVYISDHLARALSSEVQVATTVGKTFSTPLALARAALISGEGHPTGLYNSVAYKHMDPIFAQPLAVKTIVSREGLFWVPRLIEFEVGSIAKEVEIFREFSKNKKRLRAEVLRFGGREHAIRQDGQESKVRMELQAFLRELPGVIQLGQ